MGVSGGLSNLGDVLSFFQVWGGALQALVSFTSVLNRFEPQFPHLQNMVSETHLLVPSGEQTCGRH